MEQAAEVPLMIKVVAVGLWIVVFLVWERLRPAAIPPAAPRAGEAAFGWRRIARNVTLFLINSAIMADLSSFYVLYTKRSDQA